MRTATVIRFRKSQEPAVKVEPVQTDASGRNWNATIYRTQEDGAPLLTSYGNFWLKPGRSHAE